ncbi:MAG: gliding motility-associated C-terminal domain-containing protein [Crocinitomicaceae bacterium]|nr:gliding motility-associated C-terminal domain-containing protein [Crocinitomicaceae bacterium]
MRLALFLSVFLYILTNNCFTAQAVLPCEVPSDIYTCLSSSEISTKSVKNGKWTVLLGQGTIESSSSSITKVFNLSKGINKIVWTNSDNTCSDTLLITLPLEDPRVGYTFLSLIGDGIQKENELLLCSGGSWRAITTGNIFPKKDGNSVSAIGYAMYSCQPPKNPDVNNDNCAIDGPLIVSNSSSILDSAVLKNLTQNQTFWYVPVMFDNLTKDGRPIINPLCQFTGTPFKITYFNQITTSKTEYCSDGTTEIKIYGGHAEFFGSKYAIKNLYPKKAKLLKDSIASGEILTISGLPVGYPYSFDIVDKNGCVKTFSSVFPPCPACDTKVGYKPVYCQTDSIVAPNLTNGSGIGNLTVFPTEGLDIDLFTGVFNVRNSKIGEYILTNRASPGCIKDSTLIKFEIQPITPLPEGSSLDTICISAPKLADLKSINGQNLKWYNKLGVVLNPEISPAIDGVTYYCTQTLKGCESNKLQIKVFTPQVTPPVVSKVPFYACKNQSPKVGDLLPNGNTIKWYNQKNGGTALSLTTPIDTSLSYYASQVIGCESKERTYLKVKMDDPKLTMVTKDTLRYCFDEGLTVDTLFPFGENVIWYDKPVSTRPLFRSEKIESGTYYVSEKNLSTKCISDRKKVRVLISQIEVTPKLIAPKCEQSDGRIELTVQNGLFPMKFQWSNGTVQKDLVGVSIGKYEVSITDARGCKFDSEYELICNDYHPSQLVTPDGNGANDTWFLGYGDKYPNVKVLIYSRWGRLVYESGVPYKDDWGGQVSQGGSDLLPIGTYYYVIDKGNGDALEKGFLELFY